MKAMAAASGKRPGHAAARWFPAAVAAAGGILFGYDIGIIGLLAMLLSHRLYVAVRASVAD
jgi:hypothetical protein